MVFKFRRKSAEDGCCPALLVPGVPRPFKPPPFIPPFNALPANPPEGAGVEYGFVDAALVPYGFGIRGDAALVPFMVPTPVVPGALGTADILAYDDGGTLDDEPPPVPPLPEETADGCFGVNPRLASMFAASAFALPCSVRGDGPPVRGGSIPAKPTLFTRCSLPPFGCDDNILELEIYGTACLVSTGTMKEERRICTAIIGSRKGGNLAVLTTGHGY